MKIVCLPGDGIGPEVIAAAREVLAVLTPDLDFEDHPFEVQTFDQPCALCAAENVYLDEVILDDHGGHMFVCSDTDHCEKRREEGHRGHLAPEMMEPAE